MRACPRPQFGREVLLRAADEQPQRACDGPNYCDLDESKVFPTVEDVLGRKLKPYAAWVSANASAFR